MTSDVERGWTWNAWEHWSDWLPWRDQNWRTFTLMHFEVERQAYTGGWEITAVLLGLGVSLRRWSDVGALRQARESRDEWLAEHSAELSRDEADATREKGA